MLSTVQRLPMRTTRNPSLFLPTAHARARAQATAQFSPSTSDNADPATTEPPGPSTSRIISASPHIVPPVSNKRPPSATVTDEDEDNEEVLSDSVLVKLKKIKRRRVCKEAGVFFLTCFFLIIPAHLKSFPLLQMTAATMRECTIM